MATTYTWKIAQLERETEDNFVFTAHWTLNAIETTEDNQYSAGSYGSIGFQRPENLIPFENTCATCEIWSATRIVQKLNCE